MVKYINITLSFLLLWNASASANRSADCSVSAGLAVNCYAPRTAPELRVALVYYGEYWTQIDVFRFEAFIEKRFSETTSGVITLKVVGSKILPFYYRKPADYTYNQITDPARLQRIWYWQNIGMGVGQEIYNQYENDATTSAFPQVDVILSPTGAQFDGNGFSANAVVVVEQPREIAWGLPDGGLTEYRTDATLADVRIHELGHSLSLGHANDQCADPNLSSAESYACCQKSPSRNDIMGYCRDRSGQAVDETHYNKFEACTLNILKTRVVPLLLQGGKRRIPEVLHCE